MLQWSSGHWWHSYFVARCTLCFLRGDEVVDTHTHTHTHIILESQDWKVIKWSSSPVITDEWHGKCWVLFSYSFSHGRHEESIMATFHVKITYFLMGRTYWKRWDLNWFLNEATPIQSCLGWLLQILEKCPAPSLLSCNLVGKMKAIIIKNNEFPFP